MHNVKNENLKILSKSFCVHICLKRSNNILCPSFLFKSDNRSPIVISESVFMLIFAFKALINFLCSGNDIINQDNILTKV